MGDEEWDRGGAEEGGGGGREGVGVRTNDENVNEIIQGQRHCLHRCSTVHKI